MLWPGGMGRRDHIADCGPDGEMQCVRRTRGDGAENRVKKEGVMAEIISIIAVVFMLILCKVLDHKYDDRDVIKFGRERGIIK